MNMNKYFAGMALAGATGALVATAAPANGNPASRMDRSKLLIGAYCLQANARTEAHVKAIHDCGVDFIASVPVSAREMLDLFAKHGVGAIVTGVVPGWWGGNGKAGTLREVNTPEKYAAGVAAFQDHPAIWGIDIGDEPSALDFPYYGEVVRQLKEALPGMPLYLNLYPNYATVSQNTEAQARSQLGTKTYTEHVEAYCTNVPLDYLSYDFYVYVAPAGFKGYVARMYNNFLEVAGPCRRTGRSFWYIPQVNSRPGLPPLSVNCLRFQANVALSFGAEAITWGCWCKGWWENNVLDKDGNQTEQYEKLKTVNAELKTVGPQYMKFKNVDTCFVGFPERGPGVPSFKFKRAEKLDFGPFTGLHASNGARLVVGEMEPRTPKVKGHALYVTAVDDPGDENHAEFEVVFAAKKVKAFGGSGPVPVRKLDDGTCAVPISSCGAVLLVSKE